MNTPLICVKEFAVELGVSEKTVRRAARDYRPISARSFSVWRRTVRRTRRECRALLIGVDQAQLEVGKDIGELMNPKDNSLFTEFRRLSPQVTGGLLRMRQKAYVDGVVPAKYKLLTAVAISVAIRCEPCIRAYVELAREQGISQNELLEFLEVAMTMQGCPGEEWALKAFGAYKERAEDRQPTESCCVHSTG